MKLTFTLHQAQPSISGLKIEKLIIILRKKVSSRKIMSDFVNSQDQLSNMLTISLKSFKKYDLVLVIR